MNSRKTDCIYLGISIFAFLMLAISFLLMPIEPDDASAGISIYSLIAGGIFWASIIVGVVMQCILSHRRKVWYAQNHIVKVKSAERIGLLSFFKNSYAIVADIFLVFSILGMAVATAMTRGMGYACYIFISLLVFSFSMHCILNGKNFHYIINRDKILQMLKKERLNSSRRGRENKKDDQCEK